MARIALATIFWGTSPGASWQSFATYRILENLGHDVSFVNNFCFPNNHRYSLKLRAMSLFRLNDEYYKNTITFVQRRCKVDINKKYFLDFHGEYDCLIIGSDQTFNKFITNDAFVKINTSIPIFSFSSSFGLYSITANDCDNFRCFNAISLREKNDVKRMNNLGFSVKYHLDPIFLLTKANWLSISLKPRIPKRKYILLFGYSPNLQTFEFAKKIAKQKKCKVLITNYYGKRIIAGGGVHI